MRVCDHVISRYSSLPQPHTYVYTLPSHRHFKPLTLLTIVQTPHQRTVNTAEHQIHLETLCTHVPKLYTSTRMYTYSNIQNTHLTSWLCARDRKPIHTHTLKRLTIRDAKLYSRASSHFDLYLLPVQQFAPRSCCASTQPTRDWRRRSRSRAVVYTLKVYPHIHTNTQAAIHIHLRHCTSISRPLAKRLGSHLYIFYIV